MNNTANAIDRKTLVKLSIKRLADQAKSIEKSISWDIEFIEEKTELLPKLTIAKKGMEEQIAERMHRVDNLRISLQMIALMQELLTQEQKRLATVPRQARFEEGGPHA